MALNVTPATGKPPHEVAQELRKLVKALLESNGDPDDPNDPWEQINYNRGRIASFWERFDKDMTALEDAIATRRAAVIRSHAAMVRMRANSIRSYHKNEMALVDQLGGASPAPFKKKLTKIYSLIQALPTTPTPSSGKAEDSIRAVAAIVKAHFGIFDKTPAELPEHELPLVLLRIAKEQSPPEHLAWPGPVPEGPFKISVAGVDHTKFVKGWIPYANCADGEGDHSDWNEGDCAWPAAVQALIRIRAGSGNEQPCNLTNADGSVIYASCALKDHVVFHDVAAPAPS